MAIGSVTPFRPTGTVSLSAGTTSAAVALTGGGETVVVTNTSASLVYVAFGASSSVSATTSGMPVLPNTKAILLVNDLVTYAAAILASGNGTVLFTRGDGSTV
jgi:hypothetical protein